MSVLISLEPSEKGVLAVCLARPDLRVEAATEAEAIDGVTTLLREQVAQRKLVSIDFDEELHLSGNGKKPKTGTDLLALWESQGMIGPESDVLRTMEDALARREASRIPQRDEL